MLKFTSISRRSRTSFKDFHEVLRNFSSHSVSKQRNDAKEQDLQHTLVRTENGIRRITLNSVKKRNALSFSMLTELKELLLESNENEDVKVIILDHNGHVFSAGHDLKELQSVTGSTFHAQIFQRCTEVMNLVQDISRPVIAQVDGVATAAGCQLVATCDLAVASDNSTFATPGVHIGLFCTTPGVALARAVNRKQAMEMLLTGDPITAKEAFNSGLINQVVPKEEIAIATEELAQKIIRHSSAVIGLGKRAFYKQVKESRDAAYCYAADVMVDNLKHRDSQEGIDSFFAKRKPQWQ